jgi:hypothetical protein
MSWPQGPVGLVVTDHGPPWSRADELVVALRASQPDLPALILSAERDAVPLDHCRVLGRDSSADELAQAAESLLAMPRSGWHGS